MTTHYINVTDVQADSLFIEILHLFYTHTNIVQIHWTTCTPFYYIWQTFIDDLWIRLLMMWNCVSISTPNQLETTVCYLSLCRLDRLDRQNTNNGNSNVITASDMISGGGSGTSTPLPGTLSSVQHSPKAMPRYALCACDNW